MQHIAHAHDPGVREHDKAQTAGGLVKVQLVLAGPEADEGVVVAAELAGHVAQLEDGAEDELGVVVFARLAGRRCGGRAAGEGGVVVGAGDGAVGGLGEPFLGVDAFRWQGNAPLVVVSC